MSEWKSFCLGDVCKFIDYRGKTPPKVKSGVPLVTAKIIKNGFIQEPKEFIAEEFYSEWMRRGIPKKGDVVFTTEAPLGEVAQIKTDKKLAFAQRVIILESDDDVLCSGYLFYALRDTKLKSRIDARQSGTTVSGIKASELKKVEIDLPPLGTQKKIAAVLSALDDKIELNNAINKNLEEQAQAIFKKMFVDNFNPAWKSGTLSDIAEITMGQSPSGKSYNDTRKGMIFFQGRTDFGFRFPSIRMFTTEPKRIAKKGDIIFSVRAPVGDYNVALSNCCIGRGLAALSARDNYYSFLFYTMFHLKQQIDIYNGQGTVFGAINQQELKKIEVVIPEQSLICEFEKIVAPMDSNILNNHLENQRLGELRDALLPRLMSGEIDVSEVEI